MSHGRFSSIRQGRIGKTNGDSWIRQGLSRKVSRSLTVVAREFHSEAHLSPTLEAYNSTRTRTSMANHSTSLYRTIPGFGAWLMDI